MSASHAAGSSEFAAEKTEYDALTRDGNGMGSLAATNTGPSSTGGDRAVYAPASGTRLPWVVDADPWDTFTFQLSTLPASGHAAFGANGWTYTPNPGFTSGVDRFTYRAMDSAGASAPGTARVRVYDAAALAECTRGSTVNADGTLGVRTKSNSCTFYGSTVTRTSNTGAGTLIDHFVNWPSSNIKPKAVVVLIGGGDLTLNLTGNISTGVADGTGGGNFVIRIAQMLADAGYITIALDRPSDLPAPGAFDPIPDVDRYRISVKHAADILTIVKRVNPDNLDVFLAGTSRGALSVVANNLIATGIAVSSPVTRDSTTGHLHVGHPGTPSLQASFIKRPVHLLWHQQDMCSLSAPAGSQAFYGDMRTAGIAAEASVASGGVQVTAAAGNVSPDVCGAFDYHGFMGIEPSAAGMVSNWLDRQLAAMGGNRRPEAAFANYTGYTGLPRQIDLRPLVRDRDGDVLTYKVSHGTTALGGRVSVNGSAVSYIPPAGVSNKTDHFVYIAEDGKGGVGAGVIGIHILR